MKHPAIATTLNFFIPGSGLWYLGHLRWGILNLLAATAAVVSMVLIAPELFGERLHYVIFAVAAGSAGLAHSVARRESRNQRPDQTEPVSHSDASD